MLCLHILLMEGCHAVKHESNSRPFMIVVQAGRNPAAAVVHSKAQEDVKERDVAE
mgnify:CR=1 FL=1